MVIKCVLSQYRPAMQFLYETTQELVVSSALICRPQLCYSPWMRVLIGSSERLGKPYSEIMGKMVSDGRAKPCGNLQSNYGHLDWWKEWKDSRHSVFGTWFSQWKINGKNMFALTADSLYQVLMQTLIENTARKSKICIENILVHWQDINCKTRWSWQKNVNQEVFAFLVFLAWNIFTLQISAFSYIEVSPPFCWTRYKELLCIPEFF